MDQIMTEQSNRITNFPDSGSAQRVAYDLMTKILKHNHSSLENPREYLLDLYAECLSATNGRRSLKIA